ncbi:M48 family metalloprotease [Myxacorys almedinensis A]|uniref:M48 family metalloprotease n=2 Tax=Myxacorys TaxID=2056239 RepID=A0A8J8CNR0_9CYAN|nr:M48 family metallopeptidase [Myxacorys almedinensis]NDJ18692.1 M48 family metalloprotease [Myxacorys almedinensis A]
MFKQHLRHRWLYPILSLTLVFTIAFGQPLVAQAISWADLLRGGLQVIQGIQLTRLSDSQEVDLGRQMNAQLSSQGIRLLRDPSLNQYVNTIGQRLVRNSDRPNLPFTFQVVDNKSINAFATTGGYVYVHRGLMEAADNEAQLASVIGHEIGHITGGHLLAQMRKSAVQRGLLTAGGLNRSTAVNLGLQLAVNLPNNRNDEYDADRRGLTMISRAGYAQSEVVAFMQKLLSSRSSPAFLSNHPATSDRIVRLRQMIASTPARGSDGVNPTAYRSAISR